MTSLLTIAVALIAGLLLTRVIKLFKLNLPDVTAFLVAGLLIGPYGLGSLKIEGLGFVSVEAAEALKPLSSAALGFIAFAIGNEFRLSQLRQTGRQAAIIGVLQALAATFFVDVALIALHFILGADVLPMSAAITLGAIATATAPAATLMVVKQYKARGKLTDLLLPIVALDDAVGLVVFAVSFGIAQALGSGSVDALSIVVMPLLEIVCSLALGALLGVILTLLEKLFYSNSNRLSLTIAFVVLTIALSSMRIELGAVHISFSSLLVCMMLGTVFCNMCPRSGDIMERADKWTAPIFALFFIISGAELELSVFSSVAVIGIGVVYIIFRSAGKYFGSYASAALSGCDNNVKKYLGITLLPQAGVALGMCTTASALGGYEGSLIKNIVLFGVLIYELVGPTLTRAALTSAGDIHPAAPEKKSHSRFTAPKHPR